MFRMLRLYHLCATCVYSSPLLQFRLVNSKVVSPMKHACPRDSSKSLDGSTSTSLARAISLPHSRRYGRLEIRTVVRPSWLTLTIESSIYKPSSNKPSVSINTDPSNSSTFTGMAIYSVVNW